MSRFKSILLVDLDGNLSVITEATHPKGLTKGQLSQIEEGSISAVVVEDGQFRKLTELDTTDPIDAAEDDSEDEDEAENAAAAEAAEDDEGEDADTAETAEKTA